jgi:uncharacterized protein (DUF58 family)
MRPTAATLAIAWAWTLAGAAVCVWPAGVMAWEVAGAVLALVLCMDAVVAWFLKMPEVERSLPGRFAVGEAGEVVMSIRNPGRLPARLEVFDGVPAGADAPAMPWSGVVPAGERARVAHPVRMVARGAASFGPIHILRRSPGGLWLRHSLHGGADTRKVYPNYEPVVRFALLSMQHRQEQTGIVRKARAGTSRDFHQLREYHEGDPMSQIDWKATSRRQSLISRDFQEQRNQSLVFLLDTGRRMRAMDGELSQFDHCLNAMLLLSYVALKQGDHVGVQSFGGTKRWLPPVKGSHAMPLLLNHLYDYETTAQPSDFAEAAERLMVRQRRRALVVVLTNLRGEDGKEIVPALRMMRERHLVLLASLREQVIEEARIRPVADFEAALRFTAAERYGDERRTVLASVRAHGVLALDSTARDLPVALANRYLDIKAAGRL